MNEKITGMRQTAVQGEPTDNELLEWAEDEQFFLFCDEDEFLQIARSVIHKYGRGGASLLDHGFIRGWNACLEGATKAMQPVEQQSVPVFSDEDHVSIPRGLIAAACSAIDKKRDGTKTLAELRRYTFGDLSKQPAPDVAMLVEALELIAPAGTDPDVETAWFHDIAHKALAAYRKGDSQPCPAIPEGYAGATVWIGDKRVTQVVTEGSLKHESEPGMAITHAAQACLDLLAAAHRKGGQP